MRSTEQSGKSLLWEVTRRDLKKSSYFYGTMHLMCAEDAILSSAVQELIQEVDQVYLEVDMNSASELFSELLEIRSKSGKTLSNTLSETDYHKIKFFFEKFQPEVPFSVVEKQPPLMIFSALFELLLPCEHKNGIDMMIIEEAYKHQKKTKGLETILFQSSIFDSIPYEEQAKDLVKAIDNLEKNRETMEEMIRVYKDQDIEQLYSLSSSEESVVSNYMDLLLFERNRNWMSQFPGIAQNTSTLFAVGAAHLSGQNGVLELLKKQGYALRPLIN